MYSTSCVTAFRSSAPSLTGLASATCSQVICGFRNLRRLHSATISSPTTSIKLAVVASSLESRLLRSDSVVRRWHDDADPQTGWTWPRASAQAHRWSCSPAIAQRFVGSWADQNKIGILVDGDDVLAAECQAAFITTVALGHCCNHCYRLAGRLICQRFIAGSLETHTFLLVPKPGWFGGTKL